MPSSRLRGVNVIVAGAGFAGLAAARALEQDGAAVTLIEARDRVGGRVWTIRDGFQAGQHAEGGADLIEAEQTALIALIRELDLPTSRILRHGFGYYGTDAKGRLRAQPLSTTFATLGSLLAPLIRDYLLAERRWDSAIAAHLGRQSLAGWLRSRHLEPALLPRVRALRGLFLADPEDLSLLALVDFFADEQEGPGEMFRVNDGNDRIATELSRRLRTKPEFGVVLRRVRQRPNGIVASVETRQGQVERAADYLISTLPASTLREVVFEPGLPPRQREAIARLRYGAATRVLIQFDRRFWKRAGRPTAFGSDQPTGAVWDGNEQQRGSQAILSLLCGGGASRDIQDVLAGEGVSGAVNRLRWLGRPSQVLHTHTVVWEHDPWAKGGYAYFDAGFDASLRDLLAQPAGRVMFAGEHTSIRYQGYMNGALLSGQRAAAEVAALTG